MVDKLQLGKAIENLSLDQQCVCLHSSLRSFGFVQGGADAVIDSFLEQGCTLLVPTFTEDNLIPPPPGYRLKRNGSIWYDSSDLPPVPQHSRIFKSTDNAIDRTMGAIAAAVLRCPERIRGNHPHSSFTALGPMAKELIHEQAPLDWLGHLRALIRLQGKVLLMGVGLERMTLLHLAEQHAGRKPFRRHVFNTEGQPMVVEVGTCSKGYGKFSPYLEGLAIHAQVGSSHWQVFSAPKALTAATEAIEAFPQITHCGEVSCERCRDAVLGGPMLTSLTE